MSTKRKILVAGAVALAALMAAAGASDAKPGKPGGCCKGGPHWHHWHHRHVTSTFYLTSGTGCGWLWRRYLATGLNSYKWRYHACIGD